jgi:hypothetical protein
MSSLHYSTINHSALITFRKKKNKTEDASVGLGQLFSELRRRFLDDKAREKLEKNKEMRNDVK